MGIGGSHAFPHFLFNGIKMNWQDRVSKTELKLFDRVKVVKVSSGNGIMDGCDLHRDKIGQTGVIVQVGKSKPIPYKLEFKDGKILTFFEGEIEKW